MKYGFEITLDDNAYLQFNKFHMLNNPAFGKNVAVMRTIYSVFAAVGFLIAVFLSVASKPLSVIPLVVCCVWFIYRAVTIKRSSLRALEKNIGKMKAVGKMPYDEYSRLEFYEDKFVQITKYDTTETLYGKIEKIAVDSPRALYIYLNQQSAYIIPFSCFESDGKREEFISFIQAKAAENK